LIWTLKDSKIYFLVVAQHRPEATTLFLLLPLLSLLPQGHQIQAPVTAVALNVMHQW